MYTLVHYQDTKHLVLTMEKNMPEVHSEGDISN